MIDLLAEICGSSPKSLRAVLSSWPRIHLLHVLTVHTGLPGGQGPHSVTVRGMPQLSVPENELHSALFREQNPLSDSGTQPPQTFMTPPPPHVWPGGQAPMLQSPLQPSEAPQVLLVQLGVQPQTFMVPPPPQVWPAGQDPMLQSPPQPSEAPHTLPVQLGVQPQTFMVPPPPQVFGGVHEP
jgi:hypothetical protein